MTVFLAFLLSGLGVAQTVLALKPSIVRNKWTKAGSALIIVIGLSFLISTWLQADQAVQADEEKKSIERNFNELDSMHFLAINDIDSLQRTIEQIKISLDSLDLKIVKNQFGFIFIEGGGNYNIYDNKFYGPPPPTLNQRIEKSA